jgi:hypothetical protein
LADLLRVELARRTGRAKERQRRLKIKLGIIGPAAAPAACGYAADRSALSATQLRFGCSRLSLLCRFRHSVLSVAQIRVHRAALWRGGYWPEVEYDRGPLTAGNLRAELTLSAIDNYYSVYNGGDSFIYATDSLSRTPTAKPAVRRANPGRRLEARTRPKPVERRIRQAPDR